MGHEPARPLSVEDLVAVTGEPVERLHRLRAFGLIGSEGEDQFAPEDVARVRLIQFLERRQIGLDAIAQAEREEAILGSVVQFLYPDGLGRTYSVDQALDVVGLDPDVTHALRDISGAGDEPIDEHDLQMLRAAKVALDSGFPETALLQLTRVYADALARVAEAEVRLFHFYVHEGFKAAGLWVPSF